MVCKEITNNILLGKSLIGIYRQWDQMEKAGLTGTDVIDFDVAPVQDPNYNRYSNRDEVEDDFLTIMGSWDADRTDGKFFQAKTKSSMAYLQALRRERFSPINDYLFKTMGVTLDEGVGGPEMDEQFDKVRYYAKDLGFGWSRDGWKKYLQENQLTIQEFKRDFIKGETEFMPIALEYLDLEHLVPSGAPFYKVTEGSVDATWVAWASGKRENGFEVKINTHPRNALRQIKGTPEIFYIHEVISHGLQHLGFMNKIDKKLINSAYGITTVPGPEQFGLEGSAKTAPFLIHPLLDRLSTHSLFDLERSILEEMVKVNAIITLNNPNGDATDWRLAREMVHSYLPSETDERIDVMFEKMTKDIVWRSYFVAYAEGTLFLRDAVSRLSYGNKQRLAKSFYEKPRTPGQIEQLVDSLKARDNDDEDRSRNAQAA